MPTDTTEAPYEDWSIVELFGHNRVAGLVTADGPLMSATRLRIDIYAGDAEAPALTQYVGFPVYRLTPTTEAIARQLGARLMPRPASRFELEPPRQPSADFAADEEGGQPW